MSIFSKVASRRPKANAFNLSHDVKMSIPQGKLIPFLCQDVVPGDRFKINSEIFLRMAPMVAPVMHKMNVYTHFFFVPNRLVWNEWEDFITGGRNGDLQPVPPQFSPDVVDTTSGSLCDYMGLPSNIADVDTGISAIPFRAYQTVYNEYYRDQNLTAPVAVSMSSGFEDEDQALVTTTLRTRAWEKDYFTSALPWSQRGGDVTLPFAQNAEVKLDNSVGGSYQKYVTAQTGEPGTLPVGGTTTIAGTTAAGMTLGTASSRPLNMDPNGTLYADLESASGTTINDLRRSIRLQEWLEKSARGGARYIEQIASFFGVTSSDARLQRPEYLGGGKSPVSISEVLQTSESADTPQGNMAGHGVSVSNNHAISRRFEEHGYIIGIMSVLPRTAYQQGIPRHFSRLTKFDYYWPTFAHLGEQEILNKELYALSSDPDGVFGYTPRYAEYKYAPSSVHGEFRDSLSYWHMGRIFDSEPALNASFVESDPTGRIFAVEDPSVSHPIYVMMHNNVRAIRPMPRFGTPTI